MRFSVMRGAYCLSSPLRLSRGDGQSPEAEGRATGVAKGGAVCYKERTVGERYSAGSDYRGDFAHLTLLAQHNDIEWGEQVNS